MKTAIVALLLLPRITSARSLLRRLGSDSQQIATPSSFGEGYRRDAPAWLNNPSMCESSRIEFANSAPHPAWKGHTAGYHNQAIDTCTEGTAQKVWDLASPSKHMSPEELVNNMLADNVTTTTLALVGDSVTNQHYRTLRCILESSQFEPTQIGNEHVAPADGCQLWSRGGKHFELCRWYANVFGEARSRIEAMPVESWFGRRVFVLVGIGSHYNDLKSYAEDGQVFTEWWAGAKSRLQTPVTMIFRRPVPQHFNTPDGHWNGRKNQNCVASRELDAKVTLFDEFMPADTSHLVLDVFDISNSAFFAHPDPKVKAGDCTHFCVAVTYQWSVALSNVMHASMQSAPE